MSRFTKLKAILEKKGYSEKAAGGIAYNAGVKKYGKKTMSQAAQKGVSAQSIAKGKK